LVILKEPFYLTLDIDKAFNLASAALLNKLFKEIGVKIDNF
jgi:hypothetical protein